MCRMSTGRRRNASAPAHRSVPPISAELPSKATVDHSVSPEPRQHSVRSINVHLPVCSVFVVFIELNFSVCSDVVHSSLRNAVRWLNPRQIGQIWIPKKKWKPMKHQPIRRWVARRTNTTGRSSSSSHSSWLEQWATFWSAWPCLWNVRCKTSPTGSSSP